MQDSGAKAADFDDDDGGGLVSQNLLLYNQRKIGLTILSEKKGRLVLHEQDI